MYLELKRVFGWNNFFKSFNASVKTGGWKLCFAALRHFVSSYKVLRRLPVWDLVYLGGGFAILTLDFLQTILERSMVVDEVDGRGNERYNLSIPVKRDRSRGTIIATAQGTGRIKVCCMI